MATSPITIAWASTTSNKLTIDATTQGNGIVFESDVVSNLINTALYINSQATRNLQIMGGYYDAGQDYKQYQYCSQLSYVGSEYVLNFYMATQDTPTLAPTNATTFQTNTTDMQVPINPTSVQSGWQQISFIPNQANIAYVNKDNTFTGSNTFSGDITSSGNNTFSGLNSFTQKADMGKGLSVRNAPLTCTGGFSCSSTATFSSTITLPTTGGSPFIISTMKDSQAGETLFFSMNTSSKYKRVTFLTTGQNNQDRQGVIALRIDNTSTSTIPSFLTGMYILSPNVDTYSGNNLAYASGRLDISSGSGRIPSLNLSYYAYDNGTGLLGGYNKTNTMQFWYNYSSNKYLLNFAYATTIANASFGTTTFALDPEWEQDYATANYVNQKTLSLYEEIDARLSAIEEKLGIPKVASRGVDIKTRLASMEVAKSPITELFEKINNTQGYEGVLAQSNQEERLALSQARNDEIEVMKIVNSIKDRIEREAKEREEAEAQSQKEQTQESSSKSRTRKKS